MITFLCCLALLVAAYFTYGKYLDKVSRIDARATVPSKTLYDGVDYVPMPRWRTFLIQLLNIAGTGPIFGAILGACYGPVAFLWITFGGIFMGAMISESVIALIWAAISMAFFYDKGGVATVLAEHGNSAAWAVNEISNTTLGIVGGILAILGVVAAPITSGDTAFRSARLIIADIFHIEQRTKWKRLAICIPLFAIGIVLTMVDFDVVWRYFAWTNQALASVVLWCIVVYLFREKSNYWVALIPAVFMTYICSSFVFVSNQFVGMGTTPMAYVWGGVATLVLTAVMVWHLRQQRKEPMLK